MSEEMARQIGELVAGQRALDAKVDDFKKQMMNDLTTVRADMREVSKMAQEHRTGIHLLCALGAALAAIVSMAKGWWPFHK